jgi:hypothetical protein
MWIAFMVDYPGKSLRATNTEAEIDNEIAEFECDPGDIVKREFTKLDVNQVYELADLIQL